MSHPNAAHGGDGWFLRSRDARSEIGSLWRSFGQNSEFAPLKTVFLVPPSDEIRRVRDPEAALWNDLVDHGAATAEFARIVELYDRLGIEVLVPTAPGIQTANGHFARDLFTMTAGGALISRLASNIRAGEETLAMRSLIDLRIPIMGVVSAPNVFEGPDVVFFAPDEAFLGIGLRSDRGGAVQVSRMLEDIGVNCTVVETTFGCGHLDGVLGILDRNLAVLRARQASFAIYETLKNRGYEILVFEDDREADACMAINMVVIDRRTVLMPAGAKRCVGQLKEAGVSVIEIDMPAIMAGGGAIHCMTAVVEREMV